MWQFLSPTPFVLRNKALTISLTLSPSAETLFVDETLPGQIVIRLRIRMRKVETDSWGHLRSGCERHWCEPESQKNTNWSISWNDSWITTNYWLQNIFIFKQWKKFMKNAFTIPASFQWWFQWNLFHMPSKTSNLDSNLSPAGHRRELSIQTRSHPEPTFWPPAPD